MEYLDAKEPEWSEMWEKLASIAINDGDPMCSYHGHCWEYMGSTDDHHHLRHPQHPKTQKAEFIYIERRRAAVGWL